MGSTINPIFANLYAAVPGANPTGNQLSLGGPSQTSTPGANPLLPKQNLSPNAGTSGNPYDVVPGGAGSPNFPANAGPYASTGGAGVTGPGASAGSPGIGGQIAGQPTTATDWNNMYNQLKKTYGSGTAAALVDFLNSGAGYNQQAINNLLASLQPGVERGTESLMSQFSASGNRFGSGAQIGLGDYLSQVNLNEGQLVSQMYETAVNDYMNVLMGVSDTQAKAKMNQPSTFDKILGGIGLGTGAIGAIPGSGPAWQAISGAAAGAAAF